MRINTAVVAGLGVVALWASAFPAIRVAAPDLGVIGLSFIRLAVAAFALLVIAAACRVRVPKTRDLGWIFACGFFGMTAYQLLLNESELSVPAGTASIIVAAAPLVSVAVARALFNESITPVTMVGSAVALGGVAIVCLARAGMSLSASVGIVIAAMVVQGIYHPLQRPLLTTYSGLEVATYSMLAGTIMTLPFVPYGWSELVDSSTAGWIAAIYLGLLPSALGFVLWGHVTAHLPIAASTSLLYLVPPVAVLIAWLWLGEVPVTAELAGGLVVIAGVVIISQGGRITARRPVRGRRGTSHAHASAIMDRMVRNKRFGANGRQRQLLSDLHSGARPDGATAPIPLTFNNMLNQSDGIAVDPSGVCIISDGALNAARLRRIATTIRTMQTAQERHLP